MTRKDVDLQIGASIERLLKDLKAAKSQFKGFTDSIKKQASSIDEYQKVTQDVKALFSEFRDGRTKARGLRKEIKKTGDETGALARKLKQTEKANEQLSRKYQTQKDKLFELSKGLRKAGFDTSNLAKEQERLARSLESANSRANKRQRTQSAKDIIGFQSSRDVQREVDKVRAAMSRLRNEGKLAGNDIARAMKAGKQRIKELKGEARGVSSIFRELRNTVLLAFSGYEIIRFGDKVIEITDGVKSMNAQIKNAVNNERELAIAKREVFHIAQNTRTELFETGKLYSKISRSTKNYGIEQNKILKATELINKTLQIGGASTSERISVIQQLGQGLVSNTLQGEELRSLRENGPVLLEAIAKGLGRNVGEMKKLGAEGKLAAKSIIEALLTQEDAINAQFANIEKTRDQALTQLKNEFIVLVDQFDKSTGASQKLISALEYITKYLDTILNLLGRTLKVLLVFGSAKLIRSLSLMAVEWWLNAKAVGAFNVQMIVANAQSGKFIGTASKLTRVLSGLGAAFVGYEIGSFLRDEFVEVERFGIALVAGFARMKETIKGLFTTVGIEIKFALNEPISYVRKQIADFVNSQSRFIAGIEDALGLGNALSTSLKISADVIVKPAKGALNQFKNELKDAEQETKRRIAGINNEFSDLFTLAGKANKTAPKKTTGKSTGTVELEGTSDKTLKKLKKDLAKIQEELDKAAAQTLGERLNLIDKKYSQLKQDVSKFGSEEDKALVNRYLEQKKALEALKFTEQEVAEIQEQRRARISEISDLTQSGNLSDAEGQSRIKKIFEESNDEIRKLITNAEIFIRQIGSEDALKGIEKLKKGIESLDEQVLITARQVDEKLADGLVDVIGELGNGFKSVESAFKNFVKSFLRDIARMILKQQIFNALQSAGIGGGISGGVNAGVFHTGGLVGQVGGVVRKIASSNFLAAPRFHTGGLVELGPNERPIIAEKDEEILTRKDPRHILNLSGKAQESAPPVFHINNMIDSGELTAAGLNTPAGEKAFYNFVSKNKQRIKTTLG